MPQKPNKLSRFWQELKRRRVIHVITVYASAAFVIIELVGNLAEPLNLSTSLPTIVIIVLAVGFPLAVILSWIYDLTPEGMERTRPLDEIQEEEKSSVPNAWKIATYAGFAVIIGLVTYNIVKGTGGLRPGDIQSLAILPFNNFTGDDQLDWASAAMHSFLNGDMGKVGGLRVLSNTTSNALKEANISAADIAEKYNLDALVEGTLTCYGDMVCIQFRAISTYPEEKQLWVEDYMIDKSQILSLNGLVIKNIAQKMKIKLTKKEEILLAETKTVDPEAYDAYLGGIYLLDQMNPQSLHAAIDSFEKAIEIEPEWAAPHTGIASSGARMRQMGFASESDVIMMYEKLNKALELDPSSAESHSVRAGIAAWTEFDWKTAEEEFLKAIEVNPSHASSHIFYAHVLSILRRMDEALYHGKIAQELDPENPFMLGLYVVILLHAEKCKEALYNMEKALTIDPDHYFLRDGLKGIYVCLGDYEKAFEVWKGGINRTLWEEYGVTELFEKVFRERGWIAVVEEAIRVNEEVWAKDGRMDLMGQAGRYVTVGKYDRAMDYYEKIYENNNRNPGLPYLSTKHNYDKMKGNPRYLALLEKMNLPVSEE